MAYNDFIKALKLHGLDAMNEYMNRVALAIFSSFDTGTHPSEEEPEKPEGEGIGRDGKSSAFTDRRETICGFTGGKGNPEGADPALWVCV